MNRTQKIVGGVTTAAVILTPFLAQAAVDSAISGAITDASATFALVKTAMVAVGGFLIAWVFFKKIRKA